MSTLRNLILAEHSKKQVEKIVRYIGNNQIRFDELLNFTMGKEERLAQCASWSLEYCVEAHPKLATKHLKKIIQHLAKPGHHAVRRNLAKLLTFVDIPEKLESLLIENCFRILNSSEELIANRAYAAYAIERLCKKYPELYQELIASLDAQSDYDSPGMRSVMRTVKLNRDKMQKRISF